MFIFQWGIRAKRKKDIPLIGFEIRAFKVTNDSLIFMQGHDKLFSTYLRLLRKYLCLD